MVCELNLPIYVLLTHGHVKGSEKSMSLVNLDGGVHACLLCDVILRYDDL